MSDRYPVSFSFLRQLSGPWQTAGCQGSDVVILSVKATLSSLQRLVAVNASPATAIVCGATVKTQLKSENDDDDDDDDEDDDEDDDDDDDDFLLCQNMLKLVVP